MQVSSTLVIVAAELFVALLIGSIILFIYARNLKALIKKQQTKLLSLAAELKSIAQDTKPAGIDRETHERELDACKKRAESASATAISEKEALIEDLQQQLQLKDSSNEESETSVQILKEELLKAQEELTRVQEDLSSKEQALAEQAEQTAQNAEEGQSSTEALANLTLEHQELTAKLMLLESENSELKQTIADTPTPILINEPGETADSEEKDLLISELQEQLQRQVRSTQEAETCVQVLSKELLRGKEAISREEKTLAAQQLISEENQQLKSTLENLNQESQDLVAKLGALETENGQLKQTLSEAELATADSDKTGANPEQEALIVELQQQLQQLQQQHQDAEAQLAEAETRAQDTESRVQLLNQELLSAQQDLTEQEKALAEQLSLSAENQQLQQALDDITQKNADLQAKLAGAKAEHQQDSSPASVEAGDADLKEQQALVQQLQEQLEQQIVSTQESETCVQILSKELVDLKLALENQEKAVKDQEKAVKAQEKALKKQILADRETQQLELQRLEAQRLENEELKQALDTLSQKNQDLAEKLGQEDPEPT